MLSQKYIHSYKILFTGFLLFIAHSLAAALTVSIEQTNPFPPLATCGVGSGVPVKVGGKVTYAITIQNTGPGSIRDIKLDDTLTSDVNPGGTCLVNVLADRDDFLICVGNNNFHIDSHATLAAGESLTFTATFRVCTGLNEEGFSTLTNTAIVSSSDGNGVGVISASTSITSCVQGCTLEVTATPSVATSVCSNQGITLNAFVKFCCCEDQLIYSWFFQDGTPLQTGSNPELVLPVGFTPGLYYVTVSDPITNCQATSFTGFLSTESCADLEIKKTATVLGNRYTFTITVINNGPDASTVTVTDCIPSYLLVTQISGLNGSNWIFTVNDNRLTAVLVDSNNQIINLAPQTSASFQIVTQKNIFHTKNVCNTAKVIGSVFDPNLTNNSSTVKIKGK